MTHPTVVGPFVGDGVELPAMYEVRQRFDLLPAVGSHAWIVTLCLSMSGTAWTRAMCGFPVSINSTES